MVAKHDRTVTVFGGTGFLGRRIVRYLRSCGFPVRIASRHPDRGHRLFGPDEPIPFAVWHALAWASEILPGPPLTRNQVELMQIDTVSSPEMPGFIDLGISPHPVEAILQKMLSNCR
jgi:hypothetical protein